MHRIQFAANKCCKAKTPVGTRILAGNRYKAGQVSETQQKPPIPRQQHPFRLLHYELVQKVCKHYPHIADMGAAVVFLHAWLADSLLICLQVYRSAGMQVGRPNQYRQVSQQVLCGDELRLVVLVLIQYMQIHIHMYVLHMHIYFFAFLYFAYAHFTYSHLYLFVSTRQLFYCFCSCRSAGF